MKEKVLRNTKIRNLHGMGEIKRAREQRVDEVSVQKSRENHESIQQLTSQLQQMQEQMNSMNELQISFTKGHKEGKHASWKSLICT